MRKTDRFLVPWLVIDKHGVKLPHWQQGEAVQFVTFRLADAMPVQLLKSWKEKRFHWLQHNPKPWQPEQLQEYERRFTAKLELWLDQGHGSCLLREPEHRDALQSTLQKSDPADAIHHAWVIMPNHVHLLFTPRIPISKLIQQWKGVSSRAFGQGRVWQPNYYDRIVRDREHFLSVCRYIRRNAASVPTVQRGFWQSEEVKLLE